MVKKQTIDKLKAQLAEINIELLIEPKVWTNKMVQDIRKAIPKSYDEIEQVIVGHGIALCVTFDETKTPMEIPKDAVRVQLTEPEPEDTTETIFARIDKLIMRS